MVYRKLIKPFFDFLFALVAILLLSPLFVLVFFVLLICNHRPIFFTQKRPGLNEQIITITKFSTMTNECDTNGNLLPDEKRLTKLGIFLRKTSIDELPQLFNVLNGSMSFVGPRPLLVEYLNLYNSTQRLRHTVKPGITGYAQVNGRNNISWQNKLAYDVEYVKKYNFIFDIKILIKTFIQIFKSNEITKQGFATTDKFLGND